MANKNAPPSKNPANDDSLQGLMNQVLGKFLQNVDDMLPATVVSFDRETNRAQVQPLVMVVSTNGDRITRAQVASVPVFQIGGGGFILNFNLKPGDLGWIKANDRDISLFTQGYENSPPNTQRKHSFEDAVFFPDVMKGYTINEEDEENVVLQTLDGSQRVSIWSDRVKITSDNQITLDAPVTYITGALEQGTGDGGGDAHFTGNVQIDQNLHTDGDTVAGVISLKTHVHNGVQPGGGNTGQPV